MIAFQLALPPKNILSSENLPEKNPPASFCGHALFITCLSPLFYLRMSVKGHPINIVVPPLEVSPIAVPPTRHWPITSVLLLKVLHVSPQGKYSNRGRVESFEVDGRHDNWLAKD